MAKKSFKDDVKAVEMFVTVPEDNAESLKEETTNEEKVKSEKKAIENQIKKKEAAERQGTLFDVPMKKDYRYVETKSKKFQLLIQPSVFEKIKEIAEHRYPHSINDYIHSLLEKAIEDNNL